MQLNDLVIAAQACAATLSETYGYDEVLWGEVRFKNSEDIIYYVYLKDYFQAYGDDGHVQVGFFSFDFSPMALAFLIPEDFKTREERELHYMARKLGKAAELAEQFKSAAGRAFALRMSADIAKLRTMIAGPQG